MVKDQHYTNVLLFIVHRQAVDRVLRMLQNAGIELAGVRAGAEAVAACMNRLGKNGASGGATGLLHVSSEGSNFLILDHGQVVFVRSLSMALKELEGADETSMEAFSGELAKSLSAYQDLGFGRVLKKLFISGTSPALEGLAQKIKAKEGVPETEWVDYLEGFCFQAEALAKVRDSGADFFDLAAAAAETPSLQLDLTPREIRAQQKIRQESRDLAATGIWVMTLVLLTSFYLFGKIYFKTLLIKKLDDVNAKTFDEARYLERISTKSRAVRSLLEGRGKGLFVFNKITELFGEEIFLREFTYDLDGNLAVKGTADSMSRVFAFVKQMEESNYFETVKTNETKSRREGKKEVADFDISGKLKEGIT